MCVTNCVFFSGWTFSCGGLARVQIIHLFLLLVLFFSHSVIISVGCYFRLVLLWFLPSFLPSFIILVQSVLVLCLLRVSDTVICNRQHSSRKKQKKENNVQWFFFGKRNKRKGEWIVLQQIKKRQQSTKSVYFDICRILALSMGVPRGMSLKWNLNKI